MGQKCVESNKNSHMFTSSCGTNLHASELMKETHCENNTQRSTLNCVILSISIFKLI